MTTDHSYRNSDSGSIESNRICDQFPRLHLLGAKVRHEQLPGLAPQVRTGFRLTALVVVVGKQLAAADFLKATRRNQKHVVLPRVLLYTKRRSLEAE